MHYGTIFGVYEKQVYSGNADAGFILHGNPYFTPSRTVTGHNFDLGSGTVITLAQYSDVYIKGCKSGCKIGTVQLTNMTITSTSGITLSDMVYTNVSIVQGDSGGIVAGGGNSTQRYAADVIQAMDSSGKMFYCRAVNEIAALNVLMY